MGFGRGRLQAEVQRMMEVRHNIFSSGRNLAVMVRKAGG